MLAQSDSIVAENCSNTPQIVHCKAREIACWGDSLTRGDHLGWDDPAGTRRITPYPVLLQALTGTTALNFGFPGAKTTKIAESVLADDRHRACLSIIWVGTNDKDELDPQNVVDGVDSIVNHLLSPYWVVLPPLLKASWSRSRNDNLRAIRKAYLDRYANHYFDVWTCCEGISNGHIDPGFGRFQEDPPHPEDDLHPRTNWYERFVPTLWSYITSHILSE